MDMSPEEWRIFLAGYEAGVASGVTMGYREGIVDTWGAADYLRSTGLLRLPSHAELTRRRNTYKGPVQSADEIIKQAHESWGLLQSADDGDVA